MCESIQNKLNKLLNTADYADIILVVPANDHEVRHRVYAHRFMLRVGSPVFEKMLSPVPQKELEEIFITEGTIDGVDQLLKFLYTGKTNLTLSNVRNTLQLAKVYMIEKLMEDCLSFMTKTVGPDVVLSFIQDAFKYHANELKHACLQMVDRYIKGLVRRTEFTELPIEILKAIFERDTLECRESDLVTGALAWYDANSGVTEKTIAAFDFMMKEVVDLIRFPLMTPFELARGPCKAGIITTEEAYKLFTYWFADMPHPERFSSKPRAWKQNGPYFC